MEAHVDKLHGTIKERLSSCHVICILDNSSNHTKCRDDAVLSRRMTVNPGAVATCCIVSFIICLKHGNAHNFNQTIGALNVYYVYRGHKQLQVSQDYVPSSLQDGRS